jgi:hypothetical protein
VRKLFTFSINVQRRIDFLLAIVLIFTPAMLIQGSDVDAAIPGPPDEYLDLPVKAQSGSGVLWVSSDGRYTLVSSNTSLISDGLGQGTFLRDRLTNHTARLSSQNPATFSYSSLTPDLKEAVVTTNAALVSQDTNGTYDVYVHDMEKSTYELISKNSIGSSGNGVSTTEGGQLTISNNGRFVVFKSGATNLSPGNDNNGSYDVFLRDRVLGITERLSTDNSGDSADGDSGFAQISRDGRAVVFSTDASTIGNVSAPGRKVLIKRVGESSLEMASSPKLGAEQEGAYCLRPTISSDGRFVAFTCGYVQLLPGVSNPSLFHVYRYDTTTNGLTLVDTDEDNYASNVGINGYVTISGDGSRIAYIDDNAWIFYRDLHDATGSKQISQGTLGVSYLSEDGRTLVVNHFASRPALWLLPEAPEVPPEPVDDQAPTVTGVADRAADENGWYSNPIGIHWTVLDPQPSSGIATQPADTRAETEGVYTYTSDKACDNAGNCSTGSLELKIDTIPPQIERHRRHFLFDLFRGRLSGYVSDDVSGVATVDLSDGHRTLSSEEGDIQLHCATGKKECRWSIRLHDLRLKRPKLDLIVTDYAGNVTTKRLLRKD